MAPRRMLVVDDHELVRLGVRTMYPELHGVQIHWCEAASLQSAIELYRVERFDAVLLDLNLADCKGLQGLRRFLELYPRARVAVFSATQDEYVMRQARALGAAGYVGKGALANEMQAMLTALLWPYWAPEPADGAGDALFPSMPSSALYDRVAELGSRHLEVLELLLSGCTNQEICAATKLSLGTVKNYVSSLLLVLDVRSRSHLITLFR